MKWIALAAGFSIVAAIQPPPEIEKLQKQVLQLLVDHKAADAIPILDKALAKYPNSPDIHELLGGAHSVLAEALEGDEAQAPKRRTHLQQAARHFARTIELTHVNRAAHLSSLAEIYLPSGLNDPREAERFARRQMEDHPSLRSGYTLLARALIAGARGREAATVLAKAHAALEDAEDGVAVVAIVLQDLQVPTATNREVMAPVLTESLRIADEAIRRRPKDGRMLILKAAILDLQANKIEQNAARRATLLAESQALWEEGRVLNRAGRASVPEPPPAPPPEPPPAPKASQAAEAAYVRGVQLWAAVNSDPSKPAAEATKVLRQAIAALDEALKLYPGYVDAIVYKSLALRSLAKYEPDAGRAKALLAEADRLREQATKLRKQEREF